MLPNIKDPKLEWFDLENYKNYKNCYLVGWFMSLFHRRLLYDLLRNQITSFAPFYYEDLPTSADIKNKKITELVERINELNPIPLGRSPDDHDELYIFPNLPENITTPDKIKQAINKFKQVRFAREMTIYDIAALSRIISKDVRIPKRIKTKFIEKKLDEQSEDLKQPFDYLLGTNSENYLLSNGSKAHIVININTPKKQLLSDLSTLIDQYKLKLKIPNRKNFCLSQTNRWHQLRLIEYLDLILYSKIHDLKFTDEYIGSILFPRDLNSSLSEKIRKTIRPKALSLISTQYITALMESIGMERTAIKFVNSEEYYN